MHRLTKNLSSLLLGCNPTNRLHNRGQTTVSYIKISLISSEMTSPLLRKMGYNFIFKAITTKLSQDAELGLVSGL